MNDPNATPRLVIDAPVVRRNIARLAKYANEHAIGIRPHTKTHKLKRLSQMQQEAGAVGLTVAKVGEAEVMSQVGDDLLLAFPAVDDVRTRRAARIALHKTLRVAVDSITVADALAGAARAAGATIGILVDVDVGYGRTGFQTPAAALALAQHVDRAAGLRLDGMFCYPGHVWDPADRQQDALNSVSSILAAALDLWWQHGLEANIVSGGSTPTAFQSHQIEELTEIRPGTYVFNDMNVVHGGYCTLDDCAARIVATVVSDAVPGQVVLDAGSKSLSPDRCFPAPDSGHGYVVEYPEAKVTKLSEEHGQVDITTCATKPQIGERVTVIPNHICPCVNLQNSVWWQEGEAEPECLPVDARGLVT